MKKTKAQERKCDAFFRKIERAGLALSFGDVRARTRYSEISPSDSDLRTNFSRRVGLLMPIVSAAMDTVTEHKMAIVLAKLGGLGIIHRALTPKDQASAVSKVKYDLNGFIPNPICISENDTVEQVLNLKTEKGYKFFSFMAKLKRHLEYKRLILRNYDSELLKNIMNHEHLESGLYYDPKNIFNLETIYGRYLEYGQELKALLVDTDAYIRSQLGKKNILLEGSQGDMLSIKYGGYHYVTSSDCTVGGLAEGVGLEKSDVDLSLGIIKGFYMTRVGAGPFPTELGGKLSDDWCNGGRANKEIEQESYGRVSVNDADEFRQGIGLRQTGGEYGATTGRPRRIGWLDLPLLRYALGFNKPDIILTKLDVLNDCKHIKICDAYVYRGLPYYLGSSGVIMPGDCLDVAIPAAEVMQNCAPIYKTFPGWQTSLNGCNDFASLPVELKAILEFIVQRTGIKPRIISIGPDREETIIL